MQTYLDHNATTALSPRAWDVMKTLYSEFLPLNPSSMHQLGQRAKTLLVEARHQMAHLCGVSPQEVTFTSGGTESINFLIYSLSQGLPGEVVVAEGEHKALLERVRSLTTKGYLLKWVAPTSDGVITLEAVQRAVTPQTRFLALSAANSETGVLHEWEAIADWACSKQIPLIIDAVGLCGKRSIALSRGVTGWALSGHKAYGPPGTGVAILRRTTKAYPLLLGGGQEQGRRSGTEPVIALQGMVTAFQEVEEQLSELELHWTKLRNVLETQLLELFPEALIIGKDLPRLANTTCITAPGWDGEEWVIRLDQEGICVSHGSACSSGAHEPSPALRAMKLAPQWIRGALRISMGRSTSMKEIDHLLSVFKRFASNRILSSKPTTTCCMV